MSRAVPPRLPDVSPDAVWASVAYAAADAGLCSPFDALALHHASLPFPDACELAALRAAGVTDATLRLDRCAPKAATVRMMPGGRFDFRHDGRRALVIPAYGFGGDFIDMVAWFPARPDKLASLEGRAVLLGEDLIEDAATFFGGAPCSVFRDVLGWLKAGGRGLVVIDRGRTWRRLMGIGGPICGEDADHARQLLDIVTPPRACRVLAPLELEHDA